MRRWWFVHFPPFAGFVGEFFKRDGDIVLLHDEDGFVFP